MARVADRPLGLLPQGGLQGSTGTRRSGRRRWAGVGRSTSRCWARSCVLLPRQGRQDRGPDRLVPLTAAPGSPAGFCEFPGTITCPYHGYTFDATGQCVARAPSKPTSRRSPAKMKARKYPTAGMAGHHLRLDGNHRARAVGRRPPLGIQRAELDGPPVHPGRRIGEANWTEPVNQRYRQSWPLPAPGSQLLAVLPPQAPLLPQAAHTNGPIQDRGRRGKARQRQIRRHQVRPVGIPRPGEMAAAHMVEDLARAERVGRRGPERGPLDEKNWASHDHNVELPSIVRIYRSATHVHIRWGVPSRPYQHEDVDL